MEMASRMSGLVSRVYCSESSSSRVLYALHGLAIRISFWAHFIRQCDTRVGWGVHRTGFSAGEIPRYHALDVRLLGDGHASGG